MSIIKPYLQDKWFFIRERRRNPDRDDLYFGQEGNEFSPNADRAFEKHLGRLITTTKFFSHLNGERIKAIIKREPLWHGLYYKKEKCRS